MWNDYNLNLMFLEQKIKNKFTIGKVLRNQKGLRKYDPKAKQVDMPASLQQYTNSLLIQGMKINGLSFAVFETKNGLKYPGLIATETIPANRVLVRVPVECLLTTRHAFLSDIQKIFEENPKYFAKRFSSDWEDHILLTYILYEYQKGKNSIWYHLINNLPKDIDYVIFWDQKEIHNLQDHFFQLGIQKQRKKVLKQCEELIAISKKYPQFYKPNTVTTENIKWIHTHLVTRCFGKYFEYTTMVPFAQLFNHECTDVYYTMDYKENNPHNQNKEQFYEQKYLNQEEINERETSNGTYDAQDYFQDDQYLNSQLQSEESKENNSNNGVSEVHYDLGQQNIKDIRSIQSYVITFINFNDNVSLPYLAKMFQTIQHLKHTQNDEIFVKSQLQRMHAQNVKYLQLVKAFYTKLQRKTYSYGVKQKKKNTNQIIPQDQPEPNENYFQNQWPKDKFDQFLMICSTKDHFEKGSQVYFCYGRLPNKLLLMRYGIALEYNKYDHLFLRINVINYVIENKPLCKIIAKQIQFCKYKRFKIKRTKMCIDLLTFLRAKAWNYGEDIQQIFLIKDLSKQMQVLFGAQQVYLLELNKFEDSLTDNENKLKDCSLNYHQYFICVYKVEQQRILSDQIKMVKYARETIEYMIKQKKNDVKEYLCQEKRQEYFTLQIMMEHYFKYYQVA